MYLLPGGADSELQRLAHPGIVTLGLSDCPVRPVLTITTTPERPMHARECRHAQTTAHEATIVSSRILKRVEIPLSTMQFTMVLIPSLHNGYYAHN